MKNKRILTAVMTAVMGFSVCAALAACGDKGEATIRYVEPVSQTCTQPGHSGYYTDGTKYYSDKDGKNEISLADVRIAADGHTPGDFDYDDETGHWQICEVCSEHATGKVSHILNGDWIYDTPASATTPGLRHKECVCGFTTDPETTPPTGGGAATPEISSVPARPASCGVDGNTAYYTDGTKYYSDAAGEHEIDLSETVIPASGEHTEKAEWQKGNGKHWHDCSVCGLKIESTEDAHTFDWVEDTPATSATPGVKHEECECGEKRNENTPIPVLGTITHHDRNEATCGEDGNIEYWEKDGVNYSDAACTQVISGSVVLPATGEHTEAAAWQTGNGKHWHNCSVCGHKIDSTEGDHTEAAAWQTGNGKHWHNCSVCDTKLESTEDTHTFDWVEDTPATAATPGVKHEECECGETRNENTPIPALGVITHHDRNEATCGADGNIEYWEKNGVNYSDAACTQVISGSVVIPATGEHTEETAWQTGNGKHWHNCSVCGNKIDSTEGGHNYADTVVAPTCTTAGHTDHECECGDSYTDGNVSALGHAYGDVTAFDTSDNKFYKVCANGCGVPGSEVGYYGNRKVIVNGTEFTPTACYTIENADKGVTYDPVKELFVVHLNGTNYADGLTVAGDNNEVAISIDNDSAVAFITFTNGFRSLTVLGESKLTVNGNFSTEANTTNFNCEIDILGKFTGGANTVIAGGNVSFGSGVGGAVGFESTGTLTVLDGALNVYGKLQSKDITVGDADGEKAPHLNIRANGSSGISNNDIWGAPAATYRFLSGTTTVFQGGSGWTGIDFSSAAGSSLTVGSHAVLNIKGFDNGIYSGGGNATVTVNGTLNIVTVTGGSDMSALYNVVTEVSGGQLNIRSAHWSVRGGSIKISSGSATFIKNDAGGYAALRGVTNVEVSDGAVLGIKNYGQFSYEMSAEAYNISATVTAENVSGFDTGIPSGATVGHTTGTVSPSAVEIEDVPAREPVE